MDISKNIISIRESKGIKQYEVAEKLGIDPPNYSRLEKRGEKLTVEQLTKIADALGVSIFDFLGLPAIQNQDLLIQKLTIEVETYRIILLGISKMFATKEEKEQKSIDIENQSSKLQDLLKETQEKYGSQK